MAPEDRSRVAAATAAVVPFHCVICFDEFSPSIRPPMVLPCGHTFVCAPCSKRLKRCMECREPLFYTLHNGNTTTTTANNNNHGRTTAPPAPSMYGRYSPTPSTPPQSSSSSHTYNNTAAPVHAHVPPVQIPFPIAKNFVLIAMMEAAERQAREATAENCSGGGDDDDDDDQDDTNGSMNASDEDEEYDLNRIISGMATFSGPCGTYAVKERQGLTLIAAEPACRDNEQDDDDDDDDDDEDPTCDDDGPKLNISASVDSIEITEPNALEMGQTVQVVRFEHGVAKLARGIGYISANSSQLVKIGGPLEKSCRLEGLLDTVINRGKDLQKELEENTRIEESLRRQIEAELQLVPNHPVVSEAPRIEDLSPSNSGDAGEPTTPRASNDPYLPMPGGGSPYKSEFILTGRPTDLRDYENRIFPFSPSSIDNSDLCGPGLPGYRGSGRGAAAFEETTSYDYGCGAVLFAPTPLFHHSNNAMIEGGGALGGAGAGAGIHRVRSNSTDNHPGLGPSALSSSFDTIDFRTGMSGHRGLTNSKLNPGHSPTPRGSQLRMSEHRGIGRVRGPLQRSSASNSPS